MEVLAQVRGGAEAAAVGDLVDRRVGGLERGAGGVDALGEQPAQDRDAGLGAEAAGERALGDVGVGGEGADRQRLVQALERPRAGGGERAAARARGPAARRTAPGRPRGGAGRRSGARSCWPARRRGRGAGCAGRGPGRRRRPRSSARRPRRCRGRRARRRRAGSRAARSAASRQWVVARRPSSTPAAASANAPVQIETIRAPRAWAARSASSTGAPGTRRCGSKPGTSTVSALASASGPAWATIVEPGARPHRAGGRRADVTNAYGVCVVGPEHLRRDREVERDDRVQREDGDAMHLAGS